MIRRWEEAQQESEEIEVWACNVATVELFQVCQLSYLVGMGGGTCIGISMHEIRSALECLDVPRERWPEISSGLALMGRAAARVINKRG